MREPRRGHALKAFAFLGRAVLVIFIVVIPEILVVVVVVIHAWKTRR
jgi:hypothetical protein